MFSKLLTLFTVAFASAFAAEDQGLFAGLQQGIFLADESAIAAKGCRVPQENEKFQQLKAMLPMAKMMFANMNNGVEPHFIKNIEAGLHQLSIIFAVVVGKEYASEYCRGLILAEEARTLVMLVAGDLVGGFFGGSSKPAAQNLMNLQ